MNVVLIITTGQSDVQLVVGNTRRTFPSDTCGKMHQAIQARASWTLVDDHIKKGSLYTDSLLPPGMLKFCTPRLEAALRYAHEQHLTITHALVLDTRRENHKNDPFMSGRIIEQRLQETVGCQTKILTYLEGNETLAPHDNGVAPAMVKKMLAPGIVERIEYGIRGAFDSWKPNAIILARSGGIRDISDLVEELVNLYTFCDAKKAPRDPSPYPPIILTIEDSAHRPADSKDGISLDSAERKTSESSEIISYGAKWRALELLDRGHIFGAWGAIHYIDRSYTWTKVIESMYVWASSQTLPEDCTLPYLRSPLMAVRSALQVEFALRANDIPRAIHGTVAFLESALWDHLLKYTVVKHQSQRWYTLKVQPRANLIGKERGKPFRQEKFNALNDPFYYISDESNCPSLIAREYLQQKHLLNLANAVNQDIRNLRNDVAHTVPTASTMSSARSRMQQRGLWAGNSFLKVSLVQEVLNELGTQVILEELLNAVQEQILTS